MKLRINFLLILISFMYISCSENSENKVTIANGDPFAISKTDTFKLNWNKPNIENLVVRSDTTFNSHNYKEHTIKSYDKDGRLIQLYVSNIFESNSKNIYSTTTIYDSVGHIIYEEKTQEFIRWHCYNYIYDTSGHLVYKEGYSSGELGIKETFIYEGDKLKKEISERPTGIVENIY